MTASRGKKNKSGNSSSNNNNTDASDLVQEEKLQAVLLADHCFGSRVNGGGLSSKPQRHNVVGLSPLADDEGCHPVLCPLNNIPILDYILDFLINNGVDQVIVVTASTLLQRRLRSLHEGGGNNNDDGNDGNSSSSFGGGRAVASGLIDVEILKIQKDSAFQNAGEALRELYKRNWIRSPKVPFLLVSGDVITNVNLEEAMKAHRDRHTEDSAAIMTVILKPVARNAGSLPSSIVPASSDLCVGLVPVPSETTTSSSSPGKDSTKQPATSATNDSSASASNQPQDYRILLYSNDAEKSEVPLPCSFLFQSQSITTTTTTTTVGGGGMTIRTDLLDTGVAICSLDVLGKFDDEFDFLDVANDFVHLSVSEEEEGLQSRIYAHVLEQTHSGTGSYRSYAARAVDFRTYHAISNDLLQRWAYPLAPDHNLQQRVAAKSSDDKLYKLLVDYTTPSTNSKPTRASSKTNIVSSSKSISTDAVNKFQYKESLDPSRIGRSSVLLGPGMIGSSGQVGEDCLIQRSVVGNHVRVGDNVNIVDSHIWDGAIVEDNVSITSAVLSADCVIRRGAVISRGCVIGQGCIIDENIQLPEFTRITLIEPEDDGFNDDYDSAFGDNAESFGDQDKNKSTSSSGVVTDHDVVGPNGKGRVWQPSEADSDDDDDSDDEGTDDKTPSDMWNQIQSIGGNPSAFVSRRQRLQDKTITVADDLSSAGEDHDIGGLTESEAFSAYTEGAVTFEDTGTTSTSNAAGAPMVFGRQRGVDVVKEFKEICLEFDDEGSAPMENLAIELNSYKFAQNATYTDVTKGTTLAILQKLQITPETTDGRLIATLKSKLKFWAPLLQKLSIGTDEEQGIIHGLEAAATDGTEVSQKLQQGMTFRFLLQTLHDEDILSEDAILAWAEQRRNDENDTATVRLFQTQPVQDFLEWLEDEDDDESDEDESDDDDDDDDE